MRLSIVISAFNEENRIGKTLPRVIEYCKEFEKKYSIETQIVVVNDGSTDETYSVLRDFVQDIEIVSYNENMGKGYGLREGVRYTDSDYIYLADADFSTPVEYMEKFYEEMRDVDCVIGSRAVETENVRVSPLRKLLGNLGNLAIRSILGLNFKDTQCGFKMFNSKAKKYFLMCENNRWGYDFEFLYLLKKNDLSVKELPVKWDAVGDSKVKPFDYFKTLKELIDVRRVHG